MTWTPITSAEMQMARNVVRWIETVRTSGNGFGLYGSDWLPSDADISKSALLERLRSGKEPLDEPPPLGMACPWYALIEDAGPHYVFDVWFDKDGRSVSVLQHGYEIVENNSGPVYLLKDGYRSTSYRFRLWHDPEWKHPGGRTVGGWFIQNAAFEKPLILAE